MINAECIARLRRDVVRLREEAVLEDNAAKTSTNADAKPVFAAWAADKRQRADDIEALLTEVLTREKRT